MHRLHFPLERTADQKELDNLHSLYVDQWDWEQTITQEDRTIEFLKSTVKKIYQALKTIELKLHGKYPHISPTLPSEIRFFHSEFSSLARCGHAAWRGLYSRDYSVQPACAEGRGLPFVL